MQKIDIHLDGIAPEHVSVTTSATGKGTQLSIGLTPADTGSKRFSKRLHAHQSFEAFCENPSNQFAVAAASVVARDPGGAYNPLVLCGKEPIGKTHLLHAIGNAMLAVNPEAQVVLTGGEHFVNAVVGSLRHEAMADLRAQCRSADLFLFDDLTDIAGKERTQNEFFHTIDALVDTGRQVVIASSLPPQQVQGLAGRIASRLDSALIVELQSPDVESRKTILKMMVKSHDLSLPDEVVSCLAENFPNLRAMEGMAVRLGAYSNLTKESINLKLAQHFIAQDNLNQSFTNVDDDAQ